MLIYQRVLWIFVFEADQLRKGLGRRWGKCSWRLRPCRATFWHCLDSLIQQWPSLCSVPGLRGSRSIDVCKKQNKQISNTPASQGAWWKIGCILWESNMAMECNGSLISRWFSHEYLHLVQGFPSHVWLAILILWVLWVQLGHSECPGSRGVSWPPLPLRPSIKWLRPSCELLWTLSCGWMCR